MNKHKSRYKVVIYDCDGVILDSVESNYVFYNSVMKYLGRDEIDRNNIDARRVLHTYSFNDVMEYFFDGDPQRNDAFRFAKTIHYRDLMPYMKMEDGFVTALDQLRGNTSLAICTNRATSMDMIIDDFGLSGYFDFVMTASQVKHPKPHPEPLLKVIDYFGIKPAEAIFIGDGEVDMQSAKSAGVPFVSYKSELPALARIQHHSEIIQHIFSDK
ncbi:MAG: HAD family hydrolase [Desulfuromonadaceae bacterium]|nr:HAD family hydrolase [Desulfuromonadaceae bacterium]MDD2856538.1 HAD family hydrolase [Desulfuromonadaceae bacterium]